MSEPRKTDQTDPGASGRVHRGRWTAEVTEPLVVFLIGMRINRPWKLRQWWWAAQAMPRMLRSLADVPELGLLHTEAFTRGRTTLMVQYWRSFEHLEQFARDTELPHLAAWRRWNRQVRDSGDVGVWHETYAVEPGSVEALYANMPLFGLAAATAHVPAGRIGHSAGHRLDRGRPDTARFRPY